MVPYQVYKVTNQINGKIYVGFTKKTLEKRWEWHQKDARNNAGTSSYDRAFMRAIRKHGAENFVIEQIESVKNHEQAIEREIYWIRELGAKGKSGYNMTDGGEGVKGYLITEKRRQELSERSSGENNYWFGKSTTQSPHYGKPLSEEHIELLRLNNSNNKSTVINGIEYRSQAYAAEVLGVSRQSIKTLENWQEHSEGYKVERIVVGNGKYFGLKTTAKMLGTTCYLFKKTLKEENYVKTPWTFEEFLDYTRSLQKSPVGVEYQDNTYSSIKEACRLLHLDRDVILRFVRDGEAKFVESGRYKPSHNSKQVEFCGEVFESKSRLMGFFGISGKEFNRLVASAEIKVLHGH